MLGLEFVADNLCPRLTTILVLVVVVLEHNTFALSFTVFDKVVGFGKTLREVFFATVLDDGNRWNNVQACSNGSWRVFVIAQQTFFVAVKDIEHIEPAPRIIVVGLERMRHKPFTVEDV